MSLICFDIPQFSPIATDHVINDEVKEQNPFMSSASDFSLLLCQAIAEEEDWRWTAEQEVEARIAVTDELERHFNLITFSPEISGDEQEEEEQAEDEANKSSDEELFGPHVTMPKLSLPRRAKKSKRRFIIIEPEGSPKPEGIAWFSDDEPEEENGWPILWCDSLSLDIQRIPQSVVDETPVWRPSEICINGFKKRKKKVTKLRTDIPAVIPNFEGSEIKVYKQALKWARGFIIHQEIVDEASCLESFKFVPLDQNCDSCGQKFRLGSSLAVHSPCFTSDNFDCDTCGRSFKTMEYLRNHVGYHLLPQYKCRSGDCNTFSFSAHHAMRHFKSVHLNAKPFQCSICSTSFATSYACELHILNQHYNFRPFKCSICGIGKNSLEKVRVHEKSHLKETETPIKTVKPKSRKRRKKNQDDSDEEISDVRFPAG